MSQQEFLLLPLLYLLLLLLLLLLWISLGRLPMISSLETSEHIMSGDFEVKKHTVEYVAS